MNWRNTWLMVGIAFVLFGFIFLYERHIPINGAAAAPQPLLPSLRPAAVSSLQLRRGTTFAIGLEKTNGQWRYVRPFEYRAASLAVQTFLESLAEVLPAAYITPAEILARKQTSAHFGFDTPAISIALQNGTDRFEIRFGARTPAGDQVYAEVGGMPGIYVVSAAVLDQLPITQHQWRETELFTIDDKKMDRLEVTRNGAGGFSLQRDATNGLWRMVRPAHRADQLKVEYLLNRLKEARIVTFVSDDPKVDLEAFGLQNPELEANIGYGALTQRVHFGRSPTNDNTQVYARQVNTSNVVLVARAAIEPLTLPHTELRDPRLTGFAPEIVDAIEVKSEEPFAVKKQPNGTWTIAESPVDSEFVNRLVSYFGQLQVREFVKDVVTDFGPYGLANSRLQVTFRSTQTNAIGQTTNAVVAHLDFGSNQTPETIFVRRSDENSVYTIHALDLLHTPKAAWQLRDHRIWRFATNEVGRVAVRKGDSSRQFLRSGNGQWSATSGAIDPFAIEELVYRLGNLSAVAWLGRGEEARQRFGFGPDSLVLTVDLREGEKLRSVSLEFAAAKPLGVPYAVVTLDGQPWVFEFPWPLYYDMERFLSVTPRPAQE